MSGFNKRMKKNWVYVHWKIINIKINCHVAYVMNKLKISVQQLAHVV